MRSGFIMVPVVMMVPLVPVPVKRRGRALIWSFDNLRV